jgi:hypothetical protein
MTDQNRDDNVSVETPVDDRLEQSLSLDAEPDDEAAPRSTYRNLDLDQADEGDLLEQATAVPDDDEYPQG